MRYSLLVLSLAILAGVAAPLHAQAARAGAIPQWLDRLSVGGAYLGLFSGLDQDERSPADPARRGFDFAFNLDLEWTLSERVRAVAQLQSGTGAGHLGFKGSELVLTDINVVADFPFRDRGWLQSASVRVGSFDTPFGEQTAAQTNNANASNNPVLLNSLLYSVLGGTVGTLNTLGVMGTLETDFANFTAAITNGTGEDAFNPDGHLELVVSAGTDFGGSRVRAAGSFITSDDRDVSGVTGFGANFTGALGEVRVDPTDQVRLKGYLGTFSFGDGNGATDDDVVAWMGEILFRQNRWHVSGRLSGWIPGDRDGSRSGMSDAIPNPGLADDRLGVAPDLDQEIRRLQVGGGYALGAGLAIKLEFVIDDYLQETLGRETDVGGVIVALQGTF